MMVLKMMTKLRAMVIVTLRVANQHDTQMNKMMSLKVKPQFTQKSFRNNSKKKVIRMRKLTQKRRKNSNQRKFHQHSDLG